MTRRTKDEGATVEADPPTHQEDPILTQAEVARQLGYHPSTIHRLIAWGLLKGVKMPGGIYRIRKSEINKFLGGSALNKQVQ